MHRKLSVCALIRVLAGIKVLACLLGITLTQPTFAAPSLDLLSKQTQYTLNPYLYFLEDPSRSLTFDQVSGASYKDQFKPLSELPTQAVTRSFIWLRAELDFTYTEPRKWLLQFDYCPIEKLTLFTPDTNGEYQTLVTGNHVPTHLRPMADRHFLFPLQATQSSMVVYLKIETKGPVIINTQLLSEEQKRVDQRFENRLLGIIYGILIAMIMYNLFIFISIKDKRYLYYVLYIASATGGLSAHDGSFQEVFAPYTLWWSHNAIYFTVCIAVFFGSLFVRHFLELQTCAPKVNTSFKILQGICVVFLPLGFVFDNYDMTFMATFVAWGFCVLAFLGGITSVHRNVRTGRYFLAAWSALIFGIFLAGLRYMGIVPNLAFTNYFVHIGATIEVCLLSFALADRINQITAEKDHIQQEANLKLRETNEQLKQSMALKNNFLTAVSHELRTPMNGIIGSTDLLSDPHTEEEKQQYVQDIYRSSRQMMALVENILDFTEAEAGEFKPFNKDFTLHELIDPLVIRFKGKAHRKGINFNFHQPENSKEYFNHLFVNDPKIIRKIINQLLANAVKFTSAGSIDLTIKVDPDSESHSTSVISFVVTDTGIGMDEATLKDIFNAFHQADGSYKRQYEGLGIGLSLAQTLAEKIKGSLHAQSTPGEGSTFTFSLPLKKTGKSRISQSLDTKILLEKQAGKHSAGQSTISDESKNIQVLLVEDNPVNLKVLNKMVQKQGYSTITAENGQQAIDLLEHFKVNLILMDCQMPVMDGFEATRAIRQLHNGNQKVPIVAVTANTMSEDEALCYEAGMNGFTPKPINQKTIQGLLKDWLAST